MNVSVLRRVAIEMLAGGLALFGLAGCGAGTSSLAGVGGAAARPSFTVSGTVFGGQQAVVGAHVYLMGVTGSGVGSNSGSGLPSTSLLNSAQAANLDSVGAYVLTNATGGFSLSRDYAACTSSPANASQLYIYVLGGNPGAGTNPAAAFLAALGTCGSIGTSTKISVNELSTVAAAYALAGFATSATDISVGNGTVAQTGLQNAMLNAQQLVGLASGTPLTTTPNGNGTPDYQKIYTLGNILAACVNSTGSTATGSPCGTLFANALSAGSSGALPTDTATAAIYIAQHPFVSTAVIHNLINNEPPQQPYQGVAGYPADFSLGIRYTGGGLSGAHAVAIDASGDALVTNTGGSVTQFTSTGVPSSSGSSAGAATTEALDGAQSAWYTTGTTGIVEQNSGGSTVSPTAGFGGGQNSSPTAVATDGSGDVWVTNADGVSVSELIGAATPVVTPIGTPNGSTPAAGIDPSQPATAETLSQATVTHQVQLDSSLYGHNMTVSDCLAYVSMQNGTAASKLAVVNLCGTDANNVPQPALVGTFGGSYQDMNGITVSGSNLYITYAYATNPFEVWTTGVGGTHPALLGCVPLFSDQGYTTCGQSSQGNGPALYGGNPYVLGSYVYVAENSDNPGQAVQILDPSTPSAPVKVNTPGNGEGITAGTNASNGTLAGLWAPGSGSVLYVGTVTIPASVGQDPTITAYDAGQSATTPVKLGNTLNVPAGSSGYLIQNMSVQGTTVVATMYDNVAGDPGIILVADFSNPSSPSYRTLSPTSGCVPGASNFVAMQNGYAFFGCGSPSTSPTGIEVVNVSNPAVPVLLGQIAGATSATPLTRVNFIVPEGRYLFAVDINGNFDTIDTGSLFVP
jgi:hypothetical protein